MNKLKEIDEYLKRKGLFVALGIFIVMLFWSWGKGLYYSNLPHTYVYGKVIKTYRNSSGGTLYCTVVYPFDSREYQTASAVASDEIYPRKDDRVYVSIPQGYPDKGSVFLARLVPDYLTIAPPDTGWTYQQFKKLDTGFKIKEYRFFIIKKNIIFRHYWCAAPILTIA